MGRFGEAEKERASAKQIDPVAPILYQNSGEHFLYTREFDKAIEQYNEALALDSTFSLAHAGLSQAYTSKAMQKEAVEHLEEMTALDGDPGLAARMKAAYAESGYRSAIRVILEDRRQKRSKGLWLPFVDDAYFYLTLGEKNQALTALERAVQERDPNVTALQVDPIFDFIRSDPRFAELVHKVGLP
jgi:adenylate cyclase